MVQSWNASDDAGAAYIDRGQNASGVKQTRGLDLWNQPMGERDAGREAEIRAGLKISTNGSVEYWTCIDQSVPVM